MTPYFIIEKADDPRLVLTRWTVGGPLAWTDQRGMAYTYSDRAQAERIAAAEGGCVVPGGGR